MMKLSRKQIALLVVAALFAVASIGIIADGKLAECLTGLAVAAVLAWIAMRRDKAVEPSGVVDYDAALSIVSIVHESLEAASAAGVDTSLAMSALEGGRSDVSGTLERGRLSVGGGDDSPLLVARIDGSSVNVRFWAKRGAPTWEYDYDRDAETASVR